MEANLSLIALSPLFGSIAAFVFGRKLRDLAGWIATGAAFLSFLFTVNAFYALPTHGMIEQNLWTWLAVGKLQVDYLLRFDQLSAVMCLIVTGIGTLIHLYSVAYMHEDEGRHRFFAYLNLFLFAMLNLVLGGNLPVMFVGWEGVGLCSYLLIGFWFKNEAYAGAGRKAFVVNRIGDAGFLLGVFLLVQHFGTLDFIALKQAVLACADPVAFVPIFTVITVCLFIGAAGKSAQIPLFVWLPDAMAGPTPVSALIHAATMVTAGVYMMARMSFIVSLAPYALAIVSVVAILTAFISATTALTQWDIKKVLAYSTVSQLGFMFLAIGAQAYWVAIFHVMTHAFFKACLFLGAGSVIHGCHHEQDMRHMGGLAKKMPITFITYLISTLAIAGIAPLSGYYSKHAILAAMSNDSNPYLIHIANYIQLLANFTAFLTAFYMTRSLALTFFGKYRGHAHPHESPWQMTAPLIILAMLGCVGGILFGGPLSHYLSQVLVVDQHFHSEPILNAVLHSWVGLVGVGLGLLCYTGVLPRFTPALSSTFPAVYKLFCSKYYLDEIYNRIIVAPLEGAARYLWRFFDQGVIDGSVNGVGALTNVSAELSRLTQPGQVRSYALLMFLGAVFIMTFYLLM